MAEVIILTPDNPTGQPIANKILTPEDPHIDYRPQWATWVRQLVTFLLIFGVIVGVVFLGPISQLLIGSFIVALLMYLPARFISRRTRVSYKVAVGLLYLFLLGVLVVSIVGLVPIASRGISDLGKSAEVIVEDARKIIDAYDPAKPETGMIEVAGFKVDASLALRPLKDLLTSLQSSTGTAPPQTPGTSSQNQAIGGSATSSLNNVNLQGILNIVTAVVGGVLGILTGIVSTSFLSLFISFLILIELPTYQRQLMHAIPPVNHREVGLLAVKIVGVWEGFIRGQLVVGFMVGVITWLQLALMGVSSAIPLAIVVALISLIPTIGGFIALVPLGIVPLLQGSTVFTSMSNITFALLVLGINLVISQVIWNVIAPGIIGQSLNLPLPVIIVGVFLGAAIGGVAGAFLIAPILGTLRLIFMYLLMKIAKNDPFPGETWPIPV